MTKLTVTIPTYHRNALLFETVRALLPQLTSDCRLVIIDNHSPTPVEETLRELLASNPEVDCTIIRNSVNIGGSANVLRCFEVCATDWVWVLGDDDTVLPDAVQTILATIEEDPERTYVNFASEIKPRASSFVTTGLEEFACRLDNFGNAMFISASLYNCTKVKARLNHGYHYGYSCGPHMVMLMLSLGENERCLFSEKRIVRWEEKGEAQQSSIVAVTIGLPTILEFPMPETVRRDLARAMIHASFGLRATARELFYTASATGDFARARLLYDQLTYRLYYYERTPLMLLRIKAYRISLMFPRLFGAFNIWSARLTGRKINQHTHVRRTE